jgi:RNA polymerase sigma-70 factor (ECF subfamily)
MTRLERTAAAFDATQWTLLRALNSGDEQDRRRAIELLAERYWPPVYAWLRRSGRGRNEASEITQAFFADVIYHRRLFERANEERGRLRTLVLTALQNYLRDLGRRRRARPEGAAVSMDQSDGARFDVDDPSCAPDDFFTRQWALTVLNEAVARCEAHFVRAGRGGHWALFEARVLAPVRGVASPIPYADLHDSLGFRTAQDAAAAVDVVKKRLRALLHEVVAETVDGPAEEVARERRELIEALGACLPPGSAL